MLPWYLRIQPWYLKTVTHKKSKFGLQIQVQPSKDMTPPSLILYKTCHTRWCCSLHNIHCSTSRFCHVCVLCAPALICREYREPMVNLPVVMLCSKLLEDTTALSCNCSFHWRTLGGWKIRMAFVLYLVATIDILNPLEGLKLGLSFENNKTSAV